MDFGCDEIKCINLAERVDKRKSFAKMMKDNNVPFQFFSAIKDIKVPSRGCFRSHAKIISNAHKKGVKRLMVFEDDACLNKKISDKDIQEIRRFLDNEDWEIFLLGSFPNTFSSVIKKQRGYDNIYKGQFLAAGAYILNEKGIERYKNLEWGYPHKVIDRDVFMHNSKSYGHLPRVYMQRLIPNDIDYVGSKQTSIFVRLRELVNRLGIMYALHINIKMCQLFPVIIAAITISLILAIKYT